MPRNQPSLSIAVFTDDAEASLAGLFSHSSRVIPSPASTRSIRSRSARTSPVSRCPTNCAVRSPAPLRAVPIIFASTIAPGRITFADTRYSRARLNSSVGESCSIARSRRNCSSSFISLLPAGAVFHPRYSAIIPR